MQRRTIVVEHEQDSTKKPFPSRENHGQKDNEKQQKNILTRQSTDTIHTCINLKQYCSTNMDNRNDRVPQQKEIIPSDDPTKYKRKQFEEILDYLVLNTNIS